MFIDAKTILEEFYRNLGTKKRKKRKKKLGGCKKHFNYLIDSTQVKQQA